MSIEDPFKKYDVDDLFSRVDKLREQAKENESLTHRFETQKGFGVIISPSLENPNSIILSKDGYISKFEITTNKEIRFLDIEDHQGKSIIDDNYIQAHVTELQSLFDPDGNLVLPE